MMKKDKDELNFDDFESDDYDEWQYAESINIASDFIEDTLLPQILEFDFENKESDYVPGIATYALFMRLVPLLSEYGYSIDELKQSVEDMRDLCNSDSNSSGNTTLH